MRIDDVLVLGAGIHGLCSAFALSRRGLGVTVLDKFAAGHARGGSHGAARMTRSSYGDRRYVELSQRARRDGWPLLEAELGCRLVQPTPGLFFGPPDGPFGQFLAATIAAGVQVERIDVAAAARVFPQLRFEPDDAVLLDHTAGVLAADRTTVGLRAWLTERGVEIRDEVAATALHPTPEAVEVVTDRGTLRAKAVVVAVGAWLGELVPEWRASLTVLRQQVGYVKVEAPAAATAVGTFPVWARIGRDSDEFVYGLPQSDDTGLKLARHRTVGVGDDPNREAAAVDAESILELARARLTAPVEALAHSEHCLYAVTPDEHLRVERSVADSRVIAVAACSGHGFKFGPIVGEQVADLVLGP